MNLMRIPSLRSVGLIIFLAATTPVLADKTKSEEAFDRAIRRVPKPKRQAELNACSAQRVGMLSFAMRYEPSSS